MGTVLEAKPPKALTDQWLHASMQTDIRSVKTGKDKFSLVAIGRRDEMLKAKKAPVRGNFESNCFSSYVLLALIARGQ